MGSSSMQTGRTRLRNSFSQASDLVSERSESLDIKWADYFANGFDQYANWPSTRLRNNLPQGSDLVSERSEPLEIKRADYFANGFV